MRGYVPKLLKKGEKVNSLPMKLRKITKSSKMHYE